MNVRVAVALAASSLALVLVAAGIAGLVSSPAETSKDSYRGSESSPGSSPTGSS